MGHRELSRGDKGDEVAKLQSLLNRVGCMLVVDGDFGGLTERAVRCAQETARQPETGSADDRLREWLASRPEPYPPLAADGVAFIAREETGGLAYYQAVTRWPHYPGSSSGVTLGIGYDLKFPSERDFRDLWGPHLSPGAVNELCRDIGKRGSKRRVAELRRLGMEIPLSSAWSVFLEHSLPQYYRKTENIYPSLPRLPDLCRSVLVSLVCNSGDHLTGPERAEMRSIRDLLARADDPVLHKLKRKTILMDVENEIVSMQRLWDPASGVHRRRQSEANLWRSGLNAW